MPVREMEANETTRDPSEHGPRMGAGGAGRCGTLPRATAPHANPHPHENVKHPSAAVPWIEANYIVQRS